MVSKPTLYLVMVLACFTDVYNAKRTHHFSLDKKSKYQVTWESCKEALKEFESIKTWHLQYHTVNTDAGEGGMEDQNNWQQRNQKHIPWQFMCESSSTSITITPYKWVPHHTSWWHISVWPDSLTKKQAAYLKTSYHQNRINMFKWKKNCEICINKAQEVSSYSLIFKATQFGKPTKQLSD